MRTAPKSFHSCKTGGRQCIAWSPVPALLAGFLVVGIICFASAAGLLFAATSPASHDPPCHLISAAPSAHFNSCEFVKFVSGFGISRAFLVELCLNGNQNPIYHGFNTKEVIRLYETLAKVRAV